MKPTHQHRGMLLALMIFLTGCAAERAQTRSVRPTLESLATAMIDAANRGDWADYLECFTFAEQEELPGDLTGGDQRTWSQVEAERQWLQDELKQPMPMKSQLDFQMIKGIEVNGRRARVDVAARQQNGSFVVITLDAVMTDAGWRFIPVRTP